MKRMTTKFRMKRIFFPALALASVLFVPAAALADGFDFTNDQSVINEQVKASAKDKQEQRIVTSQSLANDMQMQVKLFQSAALCYSNNDPLVYNEKCTPAMRQLQSFRFNLQTLRGGQIQYKTNAEKTDMLNAGTKFDEFFPAAAGIIAWCADTFNYRDFAKKNEELKTLKRWHDDKMSGYINTLKDINACIDTARAQLVRETNEVINGVNMDKHSVPLTRQALIRKAMLEEYVSSSGSKWYPSRRGAILYDMDGHRIKLEDKKVAEYQEAHEYFMKEVTKFAPFFTKWTAEIEKVAPPYNASMASVLDTVRNCLDRFTVCGSGYGKILIEIDGSSGLGAFRSGDITSSNRWIVVKKGDSYRSGVSSGLDKLWKEAEMYNNGVARAKQGK